jgi:hypothetical protein
VIALVVNIALFAIVVYPLSKKVAGGEQQSQAANTALAAARRDNDAARATVKGKGQADQELQKFYSDVLPPDLSAARRATFSASSSLRRSPTSDSSARHPIRNLSGTAS